MRKLTAIELIDKFNKGTANAEEKAILEKWYLQQKTSDELPVIEHLLADQQRSKKILMREIGGGRSFKLWPRIIAVAAAVAAIALCTWLYTSRHLEGSTATGDLLTNTNDIAPGKNTATLSVDGKTIQLSEDKTGVIVGNDLKYNDGTALGSFANNEGAIKNITASTPRGGMYQITLPDGTHAWMNADTKISFPAQFIGKERKILLSGEAYFEVAKNKDKPFIVESEGQQVEVLGTHFNISAYKGEGIKTTLLEGSVKVMQRNSGLALPGTTLTSNEGIILKPNQQAILSDNGIKCIQVDANEAIDWKNGEFVCMNEPLYGIMNKIERWYDVEVIYTSEDLKYRTFSGSVSRYDNVSRILNTIEFTKVVKFKVEGRKIYVSKN